MSVWPRLHEHSNNWTLQDIQMSIKRLKELDSLNVDVVK